MNFVPLFAGDWRRPLKRAGVFIALWAGLMLSVPVLAQSTLELSTPADGDIAAGEMQTWTFTANAGEVLSFHLEAESDDLDPALRILNNSGQILIANDDYHYPDSQDALVEAITIPRTGTYTVEVSGVNDSAGAYALTMLPGFSQIGRSENFNGEVAWEASESLQLETADGQLSISISGASQRGAAVDTSAEASETYFAQIDVNVSGNAWIVGMTARQTADSYYLLAINASGQWRFGVQEAGAFRVIRDWTPHPAIAAGRTRFRLGMMVNGSGFDFFYDGQLVGQSVDTTLPQDGGVGLAVETTNASSSQTNALYDDLIVTIPVEVDGDRLIPSQLVLGTPTDTAQELQRRGLIPAGGEMALTVNESFVESRAPGVEELRLGRGVTYQNLAMGATVRWQAQTSGQTGCGLVVRAADTTNYTLAYLDQSGGYGVSQRVGDSFEPGIFGEVVGFSGEEHRLLVVARDDQLLYYMDGLYRGMVDNPAAEGEVGNAVVNFEPISTSCQFTQTWLWRWDVD